MNLDWSFYRWSQLQPFLLDGLLFSLQITAVAGACGLALGILLAAIRRSGGPLLSGAVSVYVTGMRAIPLLMVIMWFFLLVPYLLGRPLGPRVSAFITFTLFESAYFAEIIRAGIASVGSGQVDAARALGLTQRQAFVLIVLPQALRNMAPMLLTQVIVLFQDSSLVYVIGATDLLKGFETAGRTLGRPVEAFLGAAAAYFVLCFTLSRVVAVLRRDGAATSLRT
ncbi:MAG: amino acid ABC transporter permease [Aquabacterium sp.]|nr:MAG: amino acid ABC transporter permease [Aquabacterium sp.]